MEKILIEACMVENSPADLGIMARSILKQLDTLKLDPNFMAEFRAWKEEQDKEMEARR